MTRRKRDHDTGITLVELPKVDGQLGGLEIGSVWLDETPGETGACMAVDVELGEDCLARYVGMVLKEWDRRSGLESH